MDREIPQRPLLPAYFRSGVVQQSFSGETIIAGGVADHLPAGFFLFADCCVFLYSRLDQ